ncbi:MAG: hypothetical protein ACRBK7_14495 [Acidimicrobiales bacterium]
MDRDRLERTARRGLEEAQERRQRHRWMVTVYGWLRKTAQSVYNRVVPPAKRLLDSILGNPGLVAAFAAVAVTAGLATVAAVQADQAAQTTAAHDHPDPTADQQAAQMRADIDALTDTVSDLGRAVTNLEQQPPPVIEVTPDDLASIEDRVDAAAAELQRISGDVIDLTEELDGPQAATATAVDTTGQVAGLVDRIDAVAAEVAALAAMIDALTATTTTVAEPSTTTTLAPTTATPTTTEPAATTSTAAPPPPFGGGGGICPDPADPACP